MEGASLQSYKLLNTPIIENNDKDPICRLSKLFGKIIWKSTLIAGVHNKCCFKVFLIINGERFSSTGTTLNQAKESCALLALASLKNVHNEVGIGNSNASDGQRDIAPHKTTTDKRNYLSLVLEEKENQYYKKHELQNITILPSTMQNNFLVQSKNIDLRKPMEQTLTTKKFSTTNLVNVQSMEMKFCTRSFAKNPLIGLESPNQLSNEVNVVERNCMHTLKRIREHIREVNELPQIKKRFITENSVCKYPITKLSKENDHPINYIKNYYPNLQFTLEAEMGTSLVSYFMMSAMLGHRKFFGHGKTKFLAKNDIAKQILCYLENNQLRIENLSSRLNNQLHQQINIYCERNGDSSTLLLPSCIADIMEAKIIERFKQLTCGRQDFLMYKVIAGIVMTYNLNFQQAEVVSIATGTKCVNGGNICCSGSVINDSHAEILAKRGLTKFLYAQLRSHCNPNSEANSIFQRNLNSFQSPYTLKPNIHFHLYINTAPCGDARVFSLNHERRLNDMVSSFKTAQYGQLRTKVEGKFGTIPVRVRYYPQTWDGVVLGEPLHTMSCSDKIALWNIVGVQGALLSQFIDPIYLHSIVLGGMFDAEHVHRAVCGRIQQTLGYLPKPYRLNRPLIGRTSKTVTRCTNRVPNIGINWTLGDRDIETISLFTGRRIHNQISLLSKQAFFFNFKYLCNYLPNLRSTNTSDNYSEAKQNAEVFQKAKREAFAAFYRADLGTWVKKPIEQDDFVMMLN